MKWIKQSYEIVTPLDGEAILKHIELCGRVCYKSEDKITADSAHKFVGKIIRLGHESVLEHYSFTVRFVCNRAIANEIVRHRHCAYSQESTRYVAYDNALTIVECEDIERWGSIYTQAVADAEKSYCRLRETGATAQIARDVLPLGLKTELIVTTNLREWRHILRLRTSAAAHPQMRELMSGLLQELKTKIPVVFDDISIDK